MSSPYFTIQNFKHAGDRDPAVFSMLPTVCPCIVGELFAHLVDPRAAEDHPWVHRGGTSEDIKAGLKYICHANFLGHSLENTAAYLLSESDGVPRFATAALEHTYTLAKTASSKYPGTPIVNQSRADGIKILSAANAQCCEDAQKRERFAKYLSLFFHLMMTMARQKAKAVAMAKAVAKAKGGDVSAGGK